jgi:hypothetical protein
VDSSDEETPKVKFLNMNPLLPIYQEGRKTGMEMIKVVELLLQPNEEDAVALVVPTAVSMNASFVVDTNAPHVIHFKNILADDLGAWATNGTKKLYFRASTKTKPVMKADEVSFKNQKNHFIYRATRMYFRNKSSPDLQRIVVYLTSRCKTNLKRVLHDQLKTI